MTDAERKLWSIVRNRQLGGAKFVRQLPVGPYVADFACRDANLIVEVDGGQHAGSKSDARRTAVLATFGYRVVRFWNTEVLTNPAGVYDRIMEELATAPLTHRFTTATANEGTRTKRA
jgi:very-short-patch-repair endonuclease